MVDTILALAAEHREVTPQRFVVLITKDERLPGDIRLAVSQNLVGASRKISGFIGIAQNTAEALPVRRKAALEAAKVLLPEKPVVRKWGAPADQFGFAINPAIAKEYRDIDLELATLAKIDIRDVPENARRIKKLKARQQVIRGRMQCPRPALYNSREIGKDEIVLFGYRRKRRQGLALTPEEDADEAHVKARYDSYYETNPEGMAVRVARDIGNALRTYRNCPVQKNRVSLKEQALLRMLQFLHLKGENLAELPRRQREARYAETAEALEVVWRDSEFAEAKPHCNGNFYASDSKSRPPEPDSNGQFDWLEAASIAPHCPSQEDTSFEANAIGDDDQVDLEAWMRGRIDYLAGQVREAARKRLGISFSKVYPDIVIASVKAKLVFEEEVRPDFYKYLYGDSQGELPLN